MLIDENLLEVGHNVMFHFPWWMDKIIRRGHRYLKVNSMSPNQTSIMSESNESTIEIASC